MRDHRFQKLSKILISKLERQSLSKAMKEKKCTSWCKEKLMPLKFSMMEKRLKRSSNTRKETTLEN